MGFFCWAIKLRISTVCDLVIKKRDFSLWNGKKFVFLQKILVGWKAYYIV